MKFGTQRYLWKWYVHCIWGTLELLVFEVILRSFGLFDSKWPGTKEKAGRRAKWAEI